MVTVLNTENREYITWEYQELNFALLGGLKIEGLERMRVTLKLEYKQQAVRHNLDLYNNESLDKLVRRCAERFALGTAYIASAFATLVNLLEAYRLEQVKTLAKEKEPVKQLTEAERRKAEQFLRQPDLKCLYDATFLPHRNNSMAVGQRDRCIIAVFYGCGLRKMEGTALNLDDIDLNKRLVFVRRGKGGKQRYVPIANKHAEDIRSFITEGREWFLHEHYARDYTRKYAKKKPASDEDAFFISQRGIRMTDFYKRLEYLKEKTGIEKKFGLHSLRHSIATHLLQSGMPIEEIARFLGHSSLDSTQIYTHLTNDLNHEPDG